jgi:hypothetical protein
MKEWVVLNIQQNNFEIALKDLQKKYNNGSETDASKASTMLRELVAAKNTPTNVDDLDETEMKHNEFYQDYQNVVNDVDHEESDAPVNLDSDDESGGANSRPKRIRIPEKCPLTMQPMSNPYTTPCGHIFSKEGLDSWLKSKKNTCPQAACARKGVTKNSIKPVEDSFEKKKSRKFFFCSLFVVCFVLFVVVCTKTLATTVYSSNELTDSTISRSFVLSLYFILYGTCNASRVFSLFSFCRI